DLALEAHDRAPGTDMPRDLLRFAVLEKDAVEHEGLIVRMLLDELGMNPIQQPALLVRLQHVGVLQVVARRALVARPERRRHRLPRPAPVPRRGRRRDEHAKRERVEEAAIQRKCSASGAWAKRRFYPYSRLTPPTAARRGRLALD